MRPEQARSSIRFSLGRFNTDEDVHYTLEVLPRVVEQLRSLSPHYNKDVAGAAPAGAKALAGR